MPLIDIEKQGGSLFNKQIRNLKNITMLKSSSKNYAESGSKSHLQEGDGISSGLSNLITPAVNFIKSNADVIKTGTQAISNVSTAGKKYKRCYKCN